MDRQRLFILALAGLTLGLVVRGVPLFLRESRQYAHGFRCKICRAGLCATKEPFHGPASKITENKFSRYYRKCVDPSHKHVWQATTTYDANFRGYGICADFVRVPGTQLGDEEAMAILKALPSRAARKAFMSAVCTGYDSPDYKRVEQSIDRLQSAYNNNPKRKDWPTLLKKYGLAQSTLDCQAGYTSAPT